MRRKCVTIIGDAFVEENTPKYQIAYDIGKALVDNGYRVISGGLGGAMEAVFKGARASEKYHEGDTVAIIPSFDPRDANEYADIVVPSGINVLRNGVVADFDAVIAIGGGAGTLSEMAFAWSHKRLLLGVTGFGGWSEKLAGQRMDERQRYPFEDDKVFAVATADEAIAIINEKIDLYNEYRGMITRANK